MPSKYVDLLLANNLINIIVKQLKPNMIVKYLVLMFVLTLLAMKPIDKSEIKSWTIL